MLRWKIPKETRNMMAMAWNVRFLVEHSPRAQNHRTKAKGMRALTKNILIRRERREPFHRLAVSTDLWCLILMVRLPRVFVQACQRQLQGAPWHYMISPSLPFKSCATPCDRLGSKAGSKHSKNSQSNRYLLRIFCFLFVCCWFNLVKDPRAKRQRRNRLERCGKPSVQLLHPSIPLR